MGEVARGGDDAVTRKVGAPVQVLEVIGGKRADRFLRAENLKAVGMARPQRLIREIEDLVVRRVLDGADLFQHDLPLEREVRVAERRPPHHVGDDVERARQIAVEHARLIGGGVPRGVRVERSTAGFEGQRDLLRGAPFGALEHHVLEQMGHAHLRTRLVRAGGPHPHADGRGANARHPLAEHGDAVRRGGPIDFLIQPDRV